MTNASTKVTPLRPRRPCPECGRQSAREHYPFCSARCKDVDLGRWLTGAYAIPATEDEEEDGRPESRVASPQSGMD
jgi:hypothetical protein